MKVKLFARLVLIALIALNMSLAFTGIVQAHEDPAEVERRQRLIQLSSFEEQYRRAYMLEDPAPRHALFFNEYPESIPKYLDKLRSYGTSDWDPRKLTTTPQSTWFKRLNFEKPNSSFHG